jgi:hypothetical protein
MKSIMSNMIKTDWDFTDYTSVSQARMVYADRIATAWNKSRSVDDEAKRVEFETVAKNAGKRWYNFVKSAEIAIKDTAPTIAVYMKTAVILSNIPEDKRNPEHTDLFKMVNKFAKGWKDYGGNMRDEMTFSRLRDYEDYIVELHTFLPFYDDMFTKAGL